MSHLSDGVREFEEAVATFVQSFELVFDTDWEKTKACLSDPHLLPKEGTFIYPTVEDDSKGWWNRGSLLTSYHRLIEIMEKHNIPHGLGRSEIHPEDPTQP